MLHEFERGEESQMFLDENFDKLKGDCLLVMKILYSGKRLSAKQLVQEYGLHDRRLRDLHEEFPDRVKKEWVLDERGKRKFVEYFISIPKRPTKTQLGKLVQMDLL